MKNSTSKAAICCIGENHPSYFFKLRNLFLSIDRLENKISELDRIVFFMGQPKEKYKRKLNNLGVRIINSTPVKVNTKFPYANKIKMLKKDLGYDLYLLLDYDTIVCRDFSRFLKNTVVKAKPEDGSFHLSWETWHELYDLFDIDLPSVRYVSTVDGGIMVPYFNSGVIIVPEDYREPLYESWLYCVKKMLANKDKIKYDTYFTDQAALPLALEKENIEVTPLPVEMNFPIHEVVHDMYNPEEIDPYIIHYHYCINHLGYLHSSSYPKVQKRITEFNELVKKERQNEFDNEIFWDYRYSDYPDLGSGLGSRGKELTYKRKILHQAVNNLKPQSILDIGCGDQLVTEELPDDKYTGLDISSVIISKNKDKYPERNFITGDFLTKDLSTFEMTICFDVLILIDNFTDYKRFIKKIVDITEKYGIAAGFEEKPKIYYSEITFYHQPLSLTLKDAGAKNLKLLGEYREMSIWFFTTEGF